MIVVGTSAPVEEETALVADVLPVVTAAAEEEERAAAAVAQVATREEVAAAVEVAEREANMLPSSR